MKDFYTVSYKALPREILKDLNKWRGKLCSWSRIFIIKMEFSQAVLKIQLQKTIPITKSR